uniref:Nose resistant to fluoxetine protein 6-like n=1 Tax=Saccoglossus kowalevskii TaxID=10224 RepID=A0ABM0M4T5_SACKO|nr:PREDICTED: nose resistant to fluoxetine protein 6-like [Saccoglossus kowalevskii]
MFTMLFYMYAEPWLGQGPVWYSITNKKMCEDYWWTNILYINNFYPVNNIQGCIPWVWYLANDMQFHWISPLIILPMYKKPWFGIGMLAQFLLASVIVTGVLIGYFDLSGALFTGGAVNLIPTDQPNFFDIVYTKPYCRIAPYLTGMALGFFMQRNKNIQIRNRNLISILGWVAATAIAVSVVYGLYRTSHGYELSTAEEIIYGSLSRFAWSISVAWVVFACHYGMAGLANTILSWPFWIPLSRLTYSAYLFHPIVLDVLVFNFAVPFHYTFNIIVFLFLGVTLMSYGVAALAFLAVELPMANIEKVIEDRINKIKKEK